MTWEMKEVGEIETTLGDSGVYVVIHRVVEHTVHKEYAGDIIRVRTDLMIDDVPIISFIGKANAVRKHLMRYLYGRWSLSLEHASYIGYELHRAEVDSNYVQD